MKVSKLIPTPLKQVLKLKIVLPFRLRKQYRHDYHKFLANSFLLRKERSFNNLKGAITFHAHALEKGFVHEKFRAGFGTNALNNLLSALNEYLSKEYSKDDLRFKIGIDTLKEYDSVHKKINFENNNTVRVDRWLKDHKFNNLDKIENGGYFVQNLSETKKAIQGDFSEFSASRHSVRNFGGEEVSQKKIKKAISLAGNAPSVCNRQSQHVYQIHDLKVIENILKVQAGIKGMADGISDLLVVTTDAQYFRSINERNQPYIDGGIFAMNLLYSLHYNGIAACPLNADLTIKGEKFVKSVTKMNNSECIIIFIAIGTFKNDNKIPLSKRETEEDILVRI